MDKKTFLETYSSLTDKASETCRFLAFGSIGVVWTLAAPKETGTIPPLLAGVLAFSSASIGMDFLHYFLTSILYRIWARHEHMADLPYDSEVDVPSLLHMPARCLFYGKGLCMVGAYVALGMYMKPLLFPV